MNPNTPVIVGVGQVQQRVADPLQASEPVDLMVDAVRKAAVDAGNSAMLSEVESVRVIRGVWPYKQPAGHVASMIGCPSAETVGTCFGGNMVQSTFNATARDILNGDRSLVVLVGAEYGGTQARARKAGVDLTVRETSGDYDRMIGVEQPMSGEAEKARGIVQPIQVYPMFENAIRAKNGEAIDAHLERVSALWAGFNQVAVGNPDAWIREPLTAEEIRTPGPKNRMISFPYPKFMNSNSAVDMGAAVIVTSVKRARELGIDESRWVYPWAGTDAHDTYLVSSRDNLHSSPAIRLAGKRVLELTGLGVDDLDLIDIYSCFPSAVQVAATELGISQDRPLTVTGGLTFGGGPLNNYVMHSICRMADCLREKPGARGLVTANGGFLTKHAFGVYSTESPPRDYQYADVQDEVDACPQRDWVIDHNGEATIESYTVMFGADGPVVGHAACLTPDGVRTWANTDDPAVMQAMTTEEFCGRPVSIDGNGNFNPR